jgi:mannose-6-phosphate isomerase
MLYPLTFRPIFKEKLWGGQKINTVLGKSFAPLPNCGETWEVSGVMDGTSRANISIVANGPLAGQALDQLVQEHRADLVGKHVYEQFGDSFPLLVKFIDAADDLSIQVHPNDALASERHQGSGKTEMWYIMQADAGAKLNSGFNGPVSKEEYVQAVANNTITDLLNIEKAQAGDVFFLPAGRVHYIGKGLLLAEIQQTSDITYRIYDFDRIEAATGQKRQLHTQQAVDAIDYQYYGDYKTQYEPKQNQRVNAVSSQYFVTNVLKYNQTATHDYTSLDSFVILVCVGGSLTIQSAGPQGNNPDLILSMGQCAVIPASIQSVTLVPNGEMTVLESYVP